MAKDPDMIDVINRLGDMIVDLNKTFRYQSLFKREQVWLSAWITEAAISESDSESCKTRADECLNEFINRFEEGGK